MALAPEIADADLRETASLDLFAPLCTPGRIFWVLALALLTLGFMARATRYLPGWAPWGDETALVSNIVERDYAGLMQPLDSTQVAPVGYLWSAKTSIELFGVNEHSLRLPAFLSSLAALLLMLRIARVATTGWATLLAISIFAVSTYQIRHASEMKQYATECCVAAALLVLALEAGRARLGAAWALVALAPLAQFSSLSAVFVAGGISLALAPVVWRQRSWHWWCWYAVYNATVGLSFLAVYFLVLRPQMAVHFTSMDYCWGDQMPNWRSPLALLGWLYRTATGSIFAHPFGGENSGSLPFAILFWVGIVAMWRRGDFLFLRMLAGVFALAMLAALLRKYPLGGHARLALYLSPLVTVPIAVGLASLIRWRAADSQVMLRRGLTTLGLVVVVGLGVMLKDLARPNYSTTTRDLAAFARWFWTDHAAGAPGPLLSVTQDRRAYACSPREHEYLRARYQGTLNPCLPAVPERLAGPTGLVMCTVVDYADYAKLIPAWRAALAQRYEVFGHQFYQINVNDRERAVRFDVMWVRPLTSDPAATVASATAEAR